jgi:hypothetical protein
MMLTTVCRLYDAYADADRVILLLEVSGVPLPDISLISNNSDPWYRGPAGCNAPPYTADQVRCERVLHAR